MKAIGTRHPGIAAAFGTDSGVDIQFTDSEIISMVLTACGREGIAAIPVHDEIVTAIRHKGRVAELMVQAFDTLAPGVNKPLLRLTSNPEISDRQGGSGDVGSTRLISELSSLTL